MNTRTLDAALAEFNRRVDRSGGPSARWPYSHPIGTHGYGAASLGSRGHVLAHRLAYEQETGPIPDGLTVDHECHNRSDCKGGRTCPHRKCCNPAHLKLKTMRENFVASPNFNGHKTHCPRGHKYAPDNTDTQVKVNTTSRKCRACSNERRKEYNIRHGLTPGGRTPQERTD